MSKKIVATVDTALPHIGIEEGHQVTFNDGLPTTQDGLAFYISQLSKLEAKIYESKYANINYLELIPVATDVEEWQDSWDYMSFDAVTMGKFIGSSADDLPNVALHATKSSVPLGYAGNMYDFSLDELRKAQRMGIALSDAKAKVAFRGALQHSQTVAYFGDKLRSMTGLFNCPNVAKDNSNVDWNTASGEEIFEDMNSLLTAVWLDSATAHLPNAIVLDSKRYALISSRPMSAQFPNQTILQYFKANNLFTTTTGEDIRVAPRLQLTAAERLRNGEVEKDMMMAYELNDENLAVANPIPWRALAPQLNNHMVKVPCEYKISGTEFRYPFSAKYREFAVAMA